MVKIASSSSSQQLSPQQAALLEKIYLRYPGPELKEEEIIIPPQGSESTVLIIANKVFKQFTPPSAFARGAAQNNDREKKILERLQGAPPFPRLIDANDDFISIEEKQGERLTDKLFHELDPKKQAILAADLAGAIIMIENAFPEAVAPAASPCDPDVVRRQVEELGAYIGHQRLVFCRDIFRNFETPRVFMAHGDLDLIHGNILVDRDTGHVTGIIDFGRGSLRAPVIEGLLYHTRDFFNVSARAGEDEDLLGLPQEKWAPEFTRLVHGEYSRLKGSDLDRDMAVFRLAEYIYEGATSQTGIPRPNPPPAPADRAESLMAEIDRTTLYVSTSETGQWREELLKKIDAAMADLLKPAALQGARQQKPDILKM